MTDQTRRPQHEVDRIKAYEKSLACIPEKIRTDMVMKFILAMEKNILELNAEVDRLTKALEGIATCTSNAEGDVVSIAREALKKGQV